MDDDAPPLTYEHDESAQITPADSTLTWCTAYGPDGERMGENLSIDAAAALVHRHRGLVWVDLDGPTPEQFDEVGRTFKLPERFGYETAVEHTRPRMKELDGVLFAVIKLIRYSEDQRIKAGEVGLCIGSDFVISVRHGDAPALDSAKKATDAGSLPIAGPIGVLHMVITQVLDDCEEANQDIAEDIDQVEFSVFADAEDRSDDHSRQIYRLKRQVAEVRRSSTPLVWALQRLASGQVDAAPSNSATSFRDLRDQALHVSSDVESLDRLLNDVLQADFSRLSVRLSQITFEQNKIADRQNDDMRRISAWGGMGLIPTLIAGIFGMNFVFMPELHWHYGYYLALALMLLSSVGLYALFRRNEWI